MFRLSYCQQICFCQNQVMGGGSILSYFKLFFSIIFSTLRDLGVANPELCLVPASGRWDCNN